MRISTRIFALCAALAGIAIAAPASATIYQGSFAGIEIFSAGTGTITYTIETDGTLGALSGSDILGGSVTGNEGSTTFSATFGLSDVTYYGGLSASSTQLFFDFAGTGGFALFDGDHLICFTSASGSCYGSPAGSLGLSFSDEIGIFAPARTDLIATTAVPLPATASLALAGFVLLMAARRKRLV
jgi:hypothetical protein